jgi:mono/diheme cytochrome c family protein
MLAIVDRVLAVLMWLAAALVVVVLFAGPSLIGADKPPAPAAAQPAGGEQAAADGAAIFESSCASCHTLAAAGASGSVGPNLDERQPDAAAVTAAVTNGPGTMPSFEGQLSAEEIAAVAEFVATSAGGR